MRWLGELILVVTSTGGMLVLLVLAWPWAALERRGRR